MKRLISSVLAILLLGSLAFLLLNRQQSDSRSPPKVTFTEKAAKLKPDSIDPKTNPASKITIAVNDNLTGFPAEPSSRPPVIVQFVFDENDSSPASPGEHTHIIKEWKGQFSPSIQDLASELGTANVSRLFKVRLPDGNELDIEITKHKQYGPKRGVFSGRVLGSEFSEAIFSYVNQAVSGSITLP